MHTNLVPQPRIHLTRSSYPRIIAEFVGENSGIKKYSATTEAEFAESPGDAGFFLVQSTVARPAQPQQLSPSLLVKLGFLGWRSDSATTLSEHAESSGEAGSSWSSASDTSSAAATAVSKSGGEARLRWSAKHGATSEAFSLTT